MRVDEPIVIREFPRGIDDDVETSTKDFVCCRRADDLRGLMQLVSCRECLPHLARCLLRRRGVQEGNTGRVKRRLSGFQSEILHTAPSDAMHVPDMSSRHLSPFTTLLPCSIRCKHYTAYPLQAPLAFSSTSRRLTPASAARPLERRMNTEVCARPLHTVARRTLVATSKLTPIYSGPTYRNRGSRAEPFKQ